MQEHTEQHLDKLAKKVVQSSALEKPSLDFTQHVMSKIEGSVNTVTVYKPLFSKTTWFTLALISIAGLSYILFGNVMQGEGWFNSIDFSIITNNKISALISGLSVSKTVIYTLIVFGAMFFIQIPMMKHYLNKRLEV